MVESREYKKERKEMFPRRLLEQVDVITVHSWKSMKTAWSRFIQSTPRIGASRSSLWLPNSRQLMHASPGRDVCTHTSFGVVTRPVTQPQIFVTITWRYTQITGDIGYIRNDAAG